LSGDEHFKQFVNPSKVTDGKVTLTFGILLIIGAIIILAHQGRVWVGIVGTVLSAICLIIGLADVGQASNANDTYKSDNIPAHLSVQIGLVLTLVGAIVALAFSIVAICVRRRKV
jgi:formate hydrogenlyase subunit 3/multisubunit Na+/H+ antiporter MnhD subunit